MKRSELSKEKIGLLNKVSQDCFEMVLKLNEIGINKSVDAYVDYYLANSNIPELEMVYHEFGEDEISLLYAELREAIKGALQL